MTTTVDSTTLRMSESLLWLLRLAATGLGFLLGLLVRPLVGWILDTIGDAPGPLRLAAALPTTWAVVVLTAVGLLVGLWLAEAARKESLALTIDPSGVRLAQNGAEQYLARESIGAVFRDGSELVVQGPRTEQLTRRDCSDLGRKDVQAAFTRHGYPWFDGDPREQDFRGWVDGDPALDEEFHRMLRARSRALADKSPGRAAELADELQASGIVVRDREGAQQYRYLRG